MNDTIIIKLQALNWTCGENAFFDLMMKKNASVFIDWDDSCTDMVIGHGDWQRAEHSYSECARKAEEVFCISITADGEGTILGIRNWSIDMRTIEINLNQCAALRYLTALRLNDLDIHNCFSLRELDITGGEFEHLDLTHNMALEKLQCDFSKLTCLDLSECKSLKALSCRSCQKLMHIGLGNDSMIETFIYNDKTPIKEKCLRYLEKIINSNNGKVIKE